MVKNSYEHLENIAKSVEDGKHRDVVGGLWEEIGCLQLSVLKRIGLQKSHTLLDIGCGSLRGGRHFVDFLDPGNYFGIDINESLIEAGYNIELSNTQKNKLPKNNLAAVSDFTMNMWNTQFDFAVAVSVFTHMPLNDIRVCLNKLEKQMKSGGKFCATFFESSLPHAISESVLHIKGGIRTYPNRDPYHYLYDDFVYMAGPKWTVKYLGDLGHPRSQNFIEFTKK